MEFSAEEINEFKNEALELLEEAEQHLLSLEKGSDFKKCYAAIFRVFHSLKGGAGMLKLNALQTHMHQIENHFQDCKDDNSLRSDHVSYFLSAIDSAKQILNQKPTNFDYSIFKKQTSPPQAITNNANSVSSTENPTPKNAELLYHATDTKVIVIDDEPEILEVLKDLLTESGFTVFPFNDPSKAIESVKTIYPDVVLTDFKMPSYSGLDVLKLLSKTDPDLPVIFLSGHLSKEVILESLHHGVFGALEKPFKQSDVITLCKNAAERYKVVKLLNSTINFIYFQYSDLDQYLQSKGAKEIREQVQTQFRALIEAKRRLKFLKKHY